MDLIIIQYYAVRKALINAKLRNQARRYQQGLFVFSHVPICLIVDNLFLDTANNKGVRRQRVNNYYKLRSIVEIIVL